MTDVQFTDIFTDFTCTTLVTELTKFILYNKQQIPLSYDKLHCAVTNNNKWLSKGGVLTQSHRLFTRATECVNALEEIFSEISNFFSGELYSPEVVFLFGSSLLTPKQVYRLHFPPRELGHLPKYHARQPILSELLKFILASDELNRVLSKPLQPTNMFLLFKVEGDSSSIPWLIPRPRYKIPTFGHHVHVNFSFKEPEYSSCSCKGFEIYSDESAEGSTLSQLSTSHSISSEGGNTPEEPTWYQAPLVFKGFKDIYEHGVSVSKSWVTCPNEVL